MGPSVDSFYFQRLSLCATLSRTMAIYAKGFVVLTQLGFLVAGILAVVWAGLLPVLMPALDLDASQLENPEYLLDHIGPFYALLGINLLVGTLIGAVGNGAFVRAVAGIYLQQEVPLKTCIKVGFQHAGTVLTASFLTFWGVLLGLILLYVPGIYIMVRWFVVNPAIVVGESLQIRCWGSVVGRHLILMLFLFLLRISYLRTCKSEGLGAVAAMKRSWNLVQGSWCYVFCTCMIATCLVMFIQLFYQNMLHINVYTPLGAFLTYIPNIFLGPPLASMMTIMYINLRIEKEGLNAELFAQNLGRSDGVDAGETNYSSLITHDNGDDVLEDSVSNVV